MTVKQPMNSTFIGMKNNLFDKTFRDGEGNIVLGQMPNLPILVWFSATLLKLIPTSDSIHTGLDAIAFGSLFTWAWQELFEGVNYFRRSLGFVVLIGAIASTLVKNS
jgi:hypothetical protein